MFNPGIAIGDVLTEKQVHDTFECQTTLGIRMSKKNNLFVIMSGSARNKVYADRWQADILLYNGTDINSDSSASQTLKRGNGNNNAALAETWGLPPELRPDIFLFIKIGTNRCRYMGPVEPCLKPYIAPRHDDPERNVWIFPLKVNLSENEAAYDKEIASAQKLGTKELCRQLLEESKRAHGTKAKTAPSANPRFTRNCKVAAIAKELAGGRCDLCGSEAPFLTKDGLPYLEEHHVEWLSQGGADSVGNVVALCPNCHRKMHALNQPTDVKRLKEKIDLHLSKIAVECSSLGTGGAQ